MNTAIAPNPNMANPGETKGSAMPTTKSVFGRARSVIAVGGALLIGALLVGFIPRLSQSRTAAEDPQQLAIPTVSVVTPKSGAPPAGLILPAEVNPWQETSIYSRVNGYLKSWLVDIGAHVTQDQLLAEIDTPDLDHQLDQARSQATLAQGSSQLAKITNDKWQKL